MASEWLPTTLGRMLSFANGRTSPERDDGGIFKVFGSNGLIGRSAHSNAPANTIVIGRVGSYCGSVHYSPDPCWVTDNAIRAVALQGTHSYFAFSLLRMLDLNRWRAGSGQPLINQTILSSIEVKVPPSEVQASIGCLLSQFDNRIDLLRQTNTTLESIAQALFKSWFIDFDPVRAKAEGREPEGMDAATAALFPAEFEDSALGSIPKGWRVATVADAMELNPPRSLAKGAKAPYLEMANAPTAGHRPSGRVAVRAFGSGCKFRNGDALLAKITPCLENGKSAFVDFLDEEEIGWGSTEFIVMRSRPVLPDYCAYLLARQGAFRKFAIQAMTGTSGRQRVELSRLAQFSMVLPPDPSIALSVAPTFGALQARIAANDEQAQTLADLRDALLPRLISGKLRLPETQSVLESIV